MISFVEKQIERDLHTFKPEIYHPKQPSELEQLKQLNDLNCPTIIDTIHAQAKELIKLRNASERFSDEDLSQKADTLLGNKPFDYGVWVYYPWRNTLVHIVDEDEFIELRTNRNQYKITAEERELLRRKKIGVVGLSVGNAVALTVAMERLCGELHLADFDDLEVTNLNRIRAGLLDLQLPKTVIAARQIAEIDPFIKVKVFNEGLTSQNMDAFFTDGGNLDLLVEVCDGLSLKVKSRLKAKELCIPVIMDTNDKGMIDVERFDLEPHRSILHGKIDDFDLENIDNLDDQERGRFLSQVIDLEKVSERLKISMPEIGKTITSWPQLASGVALGGAATANVVRRIFLNQLSASGRFYIDMDDAIKDQ
ncbi:MAG: hypothetical protein CL843_13895 [Crocinitomicaceae bacterium]|nr:hypothetical protein [Crocinitomicaceae bacterium]